MLRDSSRQWMGVVVIPSVLTLSIGAAHGIGFNESDAGVTPTFDRPADISTAKITNDTGTGLWGSGVVVAPNWILTASHINVTDANKTSRGVVVNGTTYDIVGVFDHPDFSLARLQSGETQPDLKLLKIEDNGSPATLTGAIGLLDGSIPLPGINTVMGGYGRTYTSYDAITGLPTAQGSDGTLRWGQNKLSIGSGGVRTSRLDMISIVSSFDPVSTGDYVDFESIVLHNDSGSGSFIRDGWEWKLAGINNLGSSSATGTVSLVPFTPWLIDTMTNNGGYTAPTTPAVPEDTGWRGWVDNTWATSGNWTSGVPTASDYVEFDATSGVSITANITTGANAAKMLTIGGQPLKPSVTQSGGTLDIGQSLILGQTASWKGDYTLSGGTLNAARAYVGFKGTSQFTHSGGASNIDEILYLGKENGSAGTYLMSGVTTTLDAENIVIGADSGSTGTFILLSGDVSTPLMIVGFDGKGTVTQTSGDVDAGDAVLIGHNDGAEGDYSLSGGTLTTDAIFVGSKGGSDGTLTVSSTGAVDATDSISVGQMGLGVLTQSGGTVVTHRLGITATGANGGDGTYTLSGGTLTTSRTKLGEVSNVGSQDGLFTQSGGTHTTDRLEVNQSGMSYTLSGGTLNINQGAAVVGTLDFDTSSATLNGAGIIDLSDATIVDANSADVNIATNSLLILPTGFDTGTHMSGLTNLGITHIYGSTLVVPTAKGFTGTGKIDDLVDVQGTGSVTAATGGAINLNNGLTVTSTGTVDLGSGTLKITSSGSEIDDADFTGKIEIEAGGTLAAIGSIDGSIYHNGGDLEIGPGTGELALTESYLALTDTNKLQIEIDGTAAGEFDRLDVTLFAILGNVLDVDVLSNYTPAIGDSFEIIEAGQNVVLAFDTVTGLDAGSGVRFGLEYNTSTVNLLAALSGDLTGDHFVDIDDLNIVMTHWNQNVTAGVFAEGDFTGDGFIGLDDLNLVLDNWNASGTPGGTPAATIPEPASLSLIGLGLVCALRKRH